MEIFGACLLTFVLVIGLIVLAVWLVTRRRETTPPPGLDVLQAQTQWLNAELYRQKARTDRLETEVLELRRMQAFGPTPPQMRVAPESHSVPANVAMDMVPVTEQTEHWSSVPAFVRPETSPQPAVAHYTQANHFQQDAPYGNAERVFEPASVKVPPSAPHPSVALGHETSIDASAASTVYDTAGQEGGPAPQHAPFVPKFSFEQWVGVRGAAALGAVVLVIAGLYFFKFSIDEGLLTPAMRVILGVALGLICTVVSEWPLRRRYPVLANWIAGAGIAILYISFWAATALFDLVGTTVGAVLMIATTAAGCALSVYRSSLAIAVLGLLGGFATPLLLSASSDRPIALFGYLLFLNVALLAIARRKEWAILLVLAAIGTFLYQVAWILGSMDERLWLGAAIVAIFVPIFAGPFSRWEKPAGQVGAWISLGATFVLALTFGAMARFQTNLLPLVGVLVVVNLGALWVAHAHRARWMSGLAAAATTGVIAAFTLLHGGDLGSSWLAVGSALLLAAVFLVRNEFGAAEDAHAIAACVMTIGVLGIHLGHMLLYARGFWAPTASVAILTLVAARISMRSNQPIIAVAAAFLSSAGIGTIHVAHQGQSFLPDENVLLGIGIGFAAALQAIALLGRRSKVSAALDHGAATYAIVFLIHSCALLRTMLITPAIFLVGVLILGVMITWSAARRGLGGWILAAAAATALTCVASSRILPPSESRPLMMFLTQAAATLYFAATPFIFGAALRRSTWTWRGAGLAPVLFFWGLRRDYVELFGAGMIGVLPLALAGLALGTLLGARRLAPEESNQRFRAIVWLSMVAMGFITAAIPLQLEKTWITIAWALEGAGALVLWRRLDHPGMKYFSGLLFAVVTIRLVANPYLLGYYPRGLPILNWLAYTYLVPLACMVVGHAVLMPVETARYRKWEPKVGTPPIAWLASMIAVGAILVGFAWINLAIFDFYAEGSELTIPWERKPQRDLTISISWALYGLMLLGIGMWRKQGALRIASLCLILLTAAKIFLFDLSHLTDLYRVASLLGLAVSLIAISFLYQRFVFRRPIAKEPQ